MTPPPRFPDEHSRFIHPDDMPPLLAAVEEARQKGTPYEFELRITRPDGSIRHTLVRGEAIRDANGVIVSIVGTTHDITERKRIQALLTASERQYRALFEQAPVALAEADVSGIVELFRRQAQAGVTDWDTHFQRHPDFLDACLAALKIERVNQRALQLLDAASPQEVNAHLPHMCNAEIRPALQSLMLEETLAIDKRELSLTACSGRHLTCVVNVSTIHNNRQAYDKVIISLEDITERKDMERAVAASRERYRNLFDNAPIGLIELDVTDCLTRLAALPCADAASLQAYLRAHPEEANACLALAVIRNANRAYLGMVAAPNLEMLRAQLLTIFLPHAYDELLRQISEAALGSANFHSELAIRNFNGRIITLDVSSLAMQSTNDARRLLIISVYDITERMRNQEQLRDYARQLRRLASEATLAEERERRRIAGVLHDHVCQMLVLMKMRCSMLRDEVDGRARDNCNEITRLIDDSIQVTRTLTADLSPPVLYELGLAAALEWLAKHLQREHHQRFLVNVPARSPAMSTEMRILAFLAAREIVLNALKHAAAGVIELAMSTTDDSVIVIVRDDGVGFEPSSSEQSGYGLFSVRERLRHLGGRLDIQSASGAGTVATLTIPLPYHTPVSDAS